MPQLRPLTAGGGGGLPFASHVVEDRTLITGQNPAIARVVGEAVVRKLRGRAGEDAPADTGTDVG